MAVTVVSWNMNWLGRSDAQRKDAWGYLFDELKADVALVQEAGNPPKGFHRVGRAHIDRHRKWGTLVVSRDHELEDVTEVRRPGREPRAWKMRQEGMAAVATAAIDGRALTLVSLYGAFDSDGWSYATMHRHLADLAPLLDSPEHIKQTVVAGDLNLTSQWSGKDKGYAPVDRALLAQFTAWGLCDVVAEGAEGPLPGCGCSDDPCRHVQTLWHTRSRKPFQDDYLFASKRIRGPLSLRVDQAAVIEHKLSDHAPLVLTLGR